jgi:hypothetical protein
MYLSRAEVRRLWPSLEMERGDKLQLEDIVAKATVSPFPSAEVGGRWTAKVEEWQSGWPPWRDKRIVKAIDTYVAANGGAGTWDDIRSHRSKHEFYDLSGRMSSTFNAPRHAAGRTELPFDSYTLDAVIESPQGNARLPITLALSNISELYRVGNTWVIDGSGANHMFRQLQRGRFSFKGLFTLAGGDMEAELRVRAVYLLDVLERGG